MQSNPDNLRFLTEQIRQLMSDQRSFDGGDGGGYDPRMEERVKRLETAAEKTVERLTAIERDVAIVKSNYATKEDLHKELHSTTWKIIASIAVLCGAVFWMAKNVSPTVPSSASVPAATQASPAPPR